MKFIKKNKTLLSDGNVMHYRTWKLKLFLFGDYAFLCAIFGLSGASGKLIKL